MTARWTALLCTLALCGCGGGSSTSPTNAAPRPAPPTQTSDTLPQDARWPAGAPPKQELVRKLWTTPLGLKFHTCLFQPTKPAQWTACDRELIDRVFQDPRYSLTRLSALELLTENLFERGDVSSSVSPRIAFLQAELQRKQHALQTDATRSLLYQLPVFVVIGVAGGSPLVQEAVYGLTKAGFFRVLGFLGREEARMKARALWKEIPWRRLFSREAARGYNPYKGFSVFLHAFPTYGIVYYALKTGLQEGLMIQDKIWLYSMQEFVDFKNI